MSVVPIEIPLSKTGGIGIDLDIKISDNLTLHLTTVKTNKTSPTQDEFMQIIRDFL